jgi:hypothetical protein
MSRTQNAAETLKKAGSATVDLVREGRVKATDAASRTSKALGETYGRAAERVGEAGDYLREADVAQMRADVARMANENRGTLGAVAAAFVIGLLLGRRS